MLRMSRTLPEDEGISQSDTEGREHGKSPDSSVTEWTDDQGKKPSQGGRQKDSVKDTMAKARAPEAQ